MRIALATTAGSDAISRDDEILAAALAGFGAQPEIREWSDREVDWAGFDRVAIRTTWDYHLRLAEFLEWVGAVARATQIVNGPALVAWNAHKSYLIELESKGVPIVPTRVLASIDDVDALLGREPGAGRDWIVKPEVGACALHTHRTISLDTRMIAELLHESLGRGKVLVQDFMSRILVEGEISLAWIDGRVAHAVRKTAAPGDFRVQTDHGGRNERIPVPPDARAIAERCMAALPEPALFGRVDLVRDDRDGWRLMELELIEPELMFEWAPESADRLAKALIAPSSS